MADVTDIEVLADETVGGEGFLQVRRLKLRNRRADGSLSDEYSCDFAVRPKGIDAVVVAIYRQIGARVEVLLRDGLRPALRFGRANQPTQPVPDGRSYLFFRELVAGIVEAGDDGLVGLSTRAAIEVKEESGYDISADEIELLGVGSFPTPGAMPERYWICAAEVRGNARPSAPQGDGSPMEEGAKLHWIELDQAIRDCVDGRIEDGKTELGLRRLRDKLKG